MDMDSAEFANQLSEQLFGYREASEQDMLDRVEYLIELERKNTLSQSAHRFVERLDELHELAEEIEQEN